jgi:pyridoxal phosphate enzyme (YggS family)
VTIAQNVARLIQELPPGVRLLAAAKSRTPAEVKEAVAAGIKIIGENYVQEAEMARRAVGADVAWHFIGHLQKNKVKKAVALFDMIETVDSLDLAREIDRRCSQAGKTMPVLIEINSGREPQKSGVFPEKTEALVTEIASLENIRVMGLMTMGPLVADLEELRPCFAATRRLFERIKSLDIPGVTMEYLSMGMTDSYRLAVEEGANLVRIGSKIFGPRSY